MRVYEIVEDEADDPLFGPVKEIPLDVDAVVDVEDVEPTFDDEDGGTVATIDVTINKLYIKSRLI